jgi:hypothetical protein
LPSIKKKYPQSTIYWATLKIAAPLLYFNEYIDQVFSYDAESILILSQMEFDVVMNVDKSQRSGALLNAVNAKEKLGFGINNNGKIIPVNEGAYYNYQLGMDDHLNSRLNQVQDRIILLKLLILIMNYTIIFSILMMKRNPS